MPQPYSAVDLHCHTRASDGRLRPEEVVAEAARCGVQLLAITDHDTTAGLDEAQRAAAAAGVGLLPGVELSTQWQGRTIHVVGLAIDPAAPGLVAGLRRLDTERQRRADAIAARLDRLGLTEAASLARADAGDARLTRTHFARALVTVGRCKSVGAAFKRYLAPGRGAYVAAEWPELTEAMDWIRDAGGQAVLAHPQAYQFGSGLRERLIAAFAAAGGGAIEVCCGNSTASDVERARREAEMHGLCGSIGSDFHAPGQPWAQLGRVAPLPRTTKPVWNRLR